MAQLFTPPFLTVLDGNGNPVSGGKVYFYQTGTTTPQTVFTDAALTTPASNPVVADSSGRMAAIYLDSTKTYRAIVKDAGGAAIRDVDPVNDTSLIGNSGASKIGTSSGKTVQQELDAPSSLATDSGATLVDHTYSGTGATKRTLAQIINEPGLSVKGFGAKGDSTTNDYTAFTNCLAQCKATGAPMFIPPGDYLWDLNGIGSAVWDPTRVFDGGRRAIPIIGAGPGVSMIHFVNASGGLTLQSSTEWFDPTLSGLRLWGSIAGPMLQFGNNNLSTDPINMLNLEDLSIENQLNSSANEALRLNYIAGGTLRNVRANAYANGTGTNNGTALKIRQAEFVSFVGGSFGNGHRGIHITDGVNFCLTFDGQTLENTDISVDHDSASSGGHFIWGAQVTNVTQYAFRSSAMLSDKRMVIEPQNFAGLGGFPSAALLDPANNVGIIIRDRAGVTAPAVPASGSPVTNTTGRVVVVTIWGGTVTADNVNGLGIGITNANPRTYIIAPGDTIGWTGASAPSWTWTNLRA